MTVPKIISSEPRGLQTNFTSTPERAIFQACSDQPSFSPNQNNLWASVPPDKADKTMPAAPGGSYYLLTNTWNCNGNIGESVPTCAVSSTGTSLPCAATSSSPAISDASIAGKKLIVNGTNFQPGAVILVNGNEVSSNNADQNPTTQLIAPKAGKKIHPGATVMLQVKNPDGGTSPPFSFTRPAG